VGMRVEIMKRSKLSLRRIIAKLFRTRRSSKRKRGRPVKSTLDLTDRQREVLLKNLTCREKAVELGMSVGWVAKWEKSLRKDIQLLFTGCSQARSRK